jgi:hypothetical protein
MIAYVEDRTEKKFRTIGCGCCAETLTDEHDHDYIIEQIKKNMNRVDGNSFGDRLRGFINELFHLAISC